MNVAVGKSRLGEAYVYRAKRARAVNDLDRLVANLELALPHFREAVRIFRAVNNMDKADEIFRYIVQTENDIRQIEIARAAAT